MQNIGDQKYEHCQKEKEQGEPGGEQRHKYTSERHQSKENDDDKMHKALMLDEENLLEMIGNQLLMLRFTDAFTDVIIDMGDVVKKAFFHNVIHFLSGKV